METVDEKMPSIQRNWRAAIAGVPAHGLVEFPLYSDGFFVDNLVEEGWPNDFLNAIPGKEQPGRVQVAVVTRLSFHVDVNKLKWPPGKTSSELYHGGWITDEIAAIASLALGVRFRAGDVSRRFDGSDQFGTPMAARSRPEPSLMLLSDNLRLPDVVGQRNLRDLEPWFKSIPDLQAEDCIALIRTARLYQDSLWIAESEPNLAWLLLVSAVEVAANRWRSKANTSVENLREILPDLATRLHEAGGESLLETAAKKLAPITGSTRKFVDFFVEHLPEPPPIRPTSPLMRVPWTSEHMKKILKEIYRYRSEALHGGTPFPAPLCMAPWRFPEDEVPVEVGSVGLGASTLGGYWDKDDLPINLHTFHYAARGALMRWWKSLILPVEEQRVSL